MKRAGVLCFCVAMTMVSCAGNGRVIGLKERIHHDDFEYRVLDYRVAGTIGPEGQRKQAQGRFFIVTFEVENRARRVAHEWDNSIAYLVDERGERYENNPALQEALDSAQHFNYSTRHMTQPGQTENTLLVFDIPRGCTRPYLMVRGDLLMGDVFDAKAFARTRVKLF